MQNKFQNKYRIESARLKNWDYGNSAAYFVTICTENKYHYFGEIHNGINNLSPLGNIVNEEWIKSIEIRPDMNLSLGEFIVMPNHFHAIIFIDKNEYNLPLTNNKSDAKHGVSTGENAAKQNFIDENVNKFGPQSKNLASIIRGFKSAVTMYARINNIPFNWQTRYHDHIIRNEREYQIISNYIINNPLKWNEDKFYDK
jgi:putative transposase